MKTRLLAGGHASTLLTICLALGFVLFAQAWTIVPRTALTDGLVEALDIETDAALPTVLVVFQLSDCAEARSRLARWNDVSGALVVGALVGPRLARPSDTRMVIERSSIDFPVRLADVRRLERALLQLGYDRTPIVMVFDADGQAAEVHPIDAFDEEGSVEALLARLARRGEVGA